MNMEIISEYLETYQGRDKFLRALSYLAKFATISTSSKEMETKFKIFSSQMSGSRVILRLLDDIPTFHYAISYEWGKKEPDWILRWAELVQIAVDIVYNPVEHICWAGDKKLINIDINQWDNASTWFWIVSLYLSLIKSLRKLYQLSNSRQHSGENNQLKGSLNSINKGKRSELLTCTRLILDISYAVSYLPPGVLWGGKFKTWQIGALGTVSSLIGLYQALNKRVQEKKCS